MKRKVFSIVGILLISGFFVGNRASCDEDVDGKSVTVEGMMQLIGNEPFAVLAIATADGEQIRLPPEDRQRFSSYQGQSVRMTGIIRLQELTTADGKQTFKQWILTEASMVE